MNLNPIAIGFGIFSTSFGYALEGAHGAAIGLAISSGLSTFLALIRE